MVCFEFSAALILFLEIKIRAQPVIIDLSDNEKKRCYIKTSLCGNHIHFEITFFYQFI